MTWWHDFLGKKERPGPKQQSQWVRVVWRQRSSYPGDNVTVLLLQKPHRRAFYHNGTLLCTVKDTVQGEYKYGAVILWCSRLVWAERETDLSGIFWNNQSLTESALSFNPHCLFIGVIVVVVTFFLICDNRPALLQHYFCHCQHLFGSDTTHAAYDHDHQQQQQIYMQVILEMMRHWFQEKVWFTALSNHG